MLHVFRNSPLGRENLLQSIYFCERLSNLPLSVYIPDHTQYLMYFDGTVVTVDLDSSYTRYRESAKEHVCGLLRTASVDFEIFTLTSFTAKALPEIPNRWQIMSCPRAISDDISRIGLGHIGPRVRAIFKEATFPVFIPSPSAKTWQRVAAFYGGSDLGLRAVRQAINLADRADVPLTLFTQLNGSRRGEYEEKIRTAKLDVALTQSNRDWIFFGSGSLEENLYAVSSDSLVVTGAAGDSLMHELVFGSKLELIQKTLPNPILVVGPHSKSL